MNKNTLITLIIILLVALGIWMLVSKDSSDLQNQRENNDQNKEEQAESDSTQTVTGPKLIYAMTYPDIFSSLDDSERDNLNSLGYIPPCIEDYDACLYYTGNEFENTNFDSAGISAHNLPDIDVETCTSFAGANTLPNSEISTTEINGETFYVTESGDVGAGHVAKETLYRTYKNDTCFEMVARIGYSQYGNYPEGSIKEFTNEDQEGLMVSMGEIIQTLSFQE